MPGSSRLARSRGADNRVRHVFVETNWVVDVACPQPFRVPAALDLLAKCSSGEIMLHVPAICLSEARKIIPMRYQVARSIDPVRRYMARVKATQNVPLEEITATHSLLSRYESAVQQDLKGLPERLEELCRADNVEWFALDTDMLEMSLETAKQVDPPLQSFDNAIVAAILVYGRRLWDAGQQDVVFAEVDADLWPWTSQGQRREPLCTLYDEARVWVYNSFDLNDPERPDGWLDR